MRNDLTKTAAALVLATAVARADLVETRMLEALAPGPMRERTQDGDRLVIRAERRTRVRVAAGGPTHSFQTLNGDITVRRARRRTGRSDP